MLNNKKNLSSNFSSINIFNNLVQFGFVKIIIGPICYFLTNVRFKFVSTLKNQAQPITYLLLLLLLIL